MSTPLSDDAFDEFAKGLLSQPDAVPFKEDAWTAMEAKMVGHSKASWIQWLMKGFLLVMLAGLFIVQSHDPFESSFKGGDAAHQRSKSNSLKRQVAIMPGRISQKDSPLIAVPSAGDGREGDAFYPSASRASSTAPSTEEKGGIRSSGSDVADSSTVLSEDAATKATDGFFSQEQSGGALARGKEQRVEHGESSGEPSAYIPFSDSTENSASSRDATVLDAADFYPLEGTGVPLVPAHLGTDSLVTDLLSIHAPKKPDKTKPDQVNDHRLYIGFAVSPDFTTVESFEEFDRPGLDYGFNAEYFLLDQVSVSSGVLLTSKIYRTTDLEAYTVPQGFWQGTLPSQINADCKVVDLPLNVRYYVNPKARRSYFVSVGSSSYLMLSEIYSYDYAEGVPTSSQRGTTQIENENNHLFGVLNASFGLKSQVGSRFFVELEPYYKSTLRQVGWGSTQLRSTGVLIYLKYKL